MPKVSSISIKLQKLDVSPPPRDVSTSDRESLLDALTADTCNKPVWHVSKSNLEIPKVHSITKHTSSAESSGNSRIEKRRDPMKKRFIDTSTERSLLNRSEAQTTCCVQDDHVSFLTPLGDYLQEKREREEARIREKEAKAQDDVKKRLEIRRKTMDEATASPNSIFTAASSSTRYDDSCFVRKTVSGETIRPMVNIPEDKVKSAEHDARRGSYIVDNVRETMYFKTEFLGRGGFGHVYLITDYKDGRQYACKIIPREHKMRKIYVEKIAHEILIHLELEHENVVRLHHYFQSNELVYILMEACPRKSLSHLLKHRGKVTQPEARYYMKQMVTGVAYIHSKNIIHRDLKPSNMLLSDNMILKIGDFGLATKANDKNTRVSVCGTPNYIAPEVLCKRACSFELDVWALGCILYTLLAGHPPFDSNSLRETYSKICNAEYTELDDSVASKNCRDLIKWLLQPQPELRPSLEKDVKQHAYLTQEYVPASLPPSCCYKMPHSSVFKPTSPITLVSTSSGNRDTWQNYTYTNTLPNAQPQTLSTQQLQQSQQTMYRSSERTAYKKSRVTHWLASKLPKLPQFKQRLSSVLCPEYKKMDFVPQSVQMNRALEACVSEMKRNNTRNPPTVEDVLPLFVIKWIDYSNKYGLGFQLSDKSVGVLFNDNTKISYTSDRRTVEYMMTDDELMRYHREKDVPLILQKKLELLRRFTEYMDDYLTEGGEIKGYATARPSKKTCVPRMRRWLRTDKAIVMELTVPLLQVNFFADHTKVVVFQEFPGRDYLITYIDTGRHTSSYWLNDLRNLGCTSDLYERLCYVCKVTREFAELDNNISA